MSRLQKKHNLVGWMEWSLHDLSVHQIFCFVLATQLLGIEATTCNSWEYRNNEICCPKCGIGYRVLKHCTVELGTNCLPCTEGTFTDHPNGLTECLRCHSCDPGAHLRIKETCSYTKNTVCSCSPGYFCVHSGDEGCELCQKHQVSPPGSKVVQPGTETSDAEVVPCPPKTFSASQDASSCQPWTNCSNKGLWEERAGNNTSDAICAAHQGRTKTIVAVCVSLVGLVLFVVGIWLYEKWRKNHRNGSYHWKTERSKWRLFTRSRVYQNPNSNAGNSSKPWRAELRTDVNLLGIEPGKACLMLIFHRIIELEGTQWII